MRKSRTLVIQTGFLGDLVLTFPLLRALRAAHPDAPITLVVREGLGDLVRGQPGVAETIVMRKRRGWFERIAPDRARLVQLRAGGFQTVYLAHRSFRTGLYAWSTRAPHRIGFAGSPSSWACTESVRYDTERHVSERLLALARPSELESGTALRSPWYVVSAAARGAAKRLLGSQGVDPRGDFLAVAPGSVWATKRWTERGFTELARWAAAQRVAVVLVGTAGERDLCERVRTRAGHRVINLAGRTSPAELAAILELSSALLGNDSGPGHLAVAVGTPVVAIFGPTDPSRGFRPLGNRVLTVDLGTSLACRPCSVHGSRRCPQGHHRCMNDLEPADVIARIEAWPLNPLTRSPDRPRVPRG